jgi:hypothetical protein
MPRFPLPRGKFTPEYTTTSRIARPMTWWRGYCTAVAWCVGGGVAAGGGWFFGLMAVRLLFGVSVLAVLRIAHVALAAPLMAGFVAVVALSCAMAAWFFLSGSRRDSDVLAWALPCVFFGAFGGGLTPVLIAVTASWLLPEASSTAVWAVAGLLCGLFAYGLSRVQAEPDDTCDEDNWVASQAHEDEPKGKEGERCMHGKSSAHLLPVVAVAVACMALVIATPPSDAGWAVLAVGLLGLASAWALAGQERRIRDLEWQLRSRGESAFEEPIKHKRPSTKGESRER